MMMSDVQAWVLLAVLVAASAVVIVALKRFEAGASGVHSHEDGTMHRHLFGGRRHEHPTAWDRWDGFLDRKLGPKPESWRGSRDEFRVSERA